MDWENWKKMPAPFMPIGREKDATYFPKANDNDDDIKDVMQDSVNAVENIDQNQDFRDFDGRNIEA